MRRHKGAEPRVSLTLTIPTSLPGCGLAVPPHPPAAPNTTARDQPCSTMLEQFLVSPGKETQQWFCKLGNHKGSSDEVSHLAPSFSPTSIQVRDWDSLPPSCTYCTKMPDSGPHHRIPKFQVTALRFSSPLEDLLGLRKHNGSPFLMPIFRPSPSLCPAHSASHVPSSGSTSMFGAKTECLQPGFSAWHSTPVVKPQLCPQSGHLKTHSVCLTEHREHIV